MSDTTLLEKTRERFSQDRYATEQTGIELMSVGNHVAECYVQLDGRHCNARGVTMGGVLFTLADFASAVAANSGEPDLYWVSLDSHIHFLSPAVCKGLKARCEPLKLGRTTALYQTKIDNPDNGKLIAVVGTTMVKVS